MLESRPDLLIPIYQVLGIKIRNVFQPGVDYREARLAEASTDISTPGTRAATTTNAPTTSLPESQAVLPELPDDSGDLLDE